MNTFGSKFRLTTFGESHGKAIGGVIDGMPAGYEISEEALQYAMDRRRPGATKGTSVSQRAENDNVELLSGVFEDKTLGTPIGFIIRNNDAKSIDYEELKDVYRPGHADFTWNVKYGIRDWRGGGRSSARETAVRVVGGYFAALVLEKYSIKVRAKLIQVGTVVGTDDQLLAEAEKYSREGDSIGGVVECVITGVPAGIGEPVFGKVQSILASAMMSIPGAKGFEYGLGFTGTEIPGSTYNDTFVSSDRCISLASNKCGGILGGITTGSDILFRVAFRPAASISKPQATVNSRGEKVDIIIKGRHDGCIAIRAVSVVEAMAKMTIADLLLQQTTLL